MPDRDPGGQASTLCFIWMAARIWKSSPGLAAVSFFVFPVALIPLIQNWGDEETDIKVPFFLVLASSMYCSRSANALGRGRLPL